MTWRTFSLTENIHTFDCTQLIGNLVFYHWIQWRDTITTNMTEKYYEMMEKEKTPNRTNLFQALGWTSNPESIIYLVQYPLLLVRGQKIKLDCLEKERQKWLSWWSRLLRMLHRLYSSRIMFIILRLKALHIYIHQNNIFSQITVGKNPFRSTFVAVNFCSSFR